MWRTSFKGLLAHKIRFVLTSLAVMLGVAFVSGTLILTDTSQAAFNNLFDDVFKGTDIVITSSEEGSSTQGLPAPFPASTQAEVESVDGVKETAAIVLGVGTLEMPDGTIVKPGGGPPVYVGNWVTPPSLSQYKLTKGHTPTSASQAVIDTGTADEYSVGIGDKIGVSAAGPLEDFEVVGLAKFDTQSDVGFAPTAFLTLAEAQRTQGIGDALQEIDVKVDENVAAKEVADRIGETLGSGFTVKTGEQAASDVAGEIRQGLSFFTTFLLAFAGIAIFVGAFIIVNTFSIVVTQRSRELALLRALGASRAQVLGSVVLEALVVGIVASSLGLLLGIGFAYLLKAVIGAFGLELPTGANVIEARTIGVAYAVGVGITLISSILPARRASKVAPIEAMRGSGEQLSERPSGLRIVAGIVLVCAGLGLALTGLFTDLGNKLALVGSGVVVLLVGVAVLAPIVVRPIVGALGVPLRSITGELGKENARRNPRRTASTAAALMIGLGLTIFVVIFNQSIKASADKQIEEAFKADLLVEADAGFGPPTVFAPAVMADIAQIDGVENSIGAAGNFSDAGFGSPWTLDGNEEVLLGMPFDGITEVVNLGITEGRIDASRPGLLVYDDKASDLGLSPGDRIAMGFPGRESPVTVQAIYSDDRILGPFVLDEATYDSEYTNRDLVAGFVRYDPGADTKRVRAEIDEVLANYPAVKANDQAELKEQTSEQLNQILGLIVVLLLLAVVISVIGIVNTLALSITERTREIGLLRAVGTTRGQLRAMIAWEAVLVALLGAVLGLALGVLFAWAVTRALADLGLGEFVMPWSFILLFFVCAGIAGVAAAILPTRRALKVDVLQAVTTE